MSSCTTTQRPVRCTDAITVSMSSGTSERRSTTSTSLPRPAIPSATSRQRGSIPPYVTSVRCRPGRATRARPNSQRRRPRTSGAFSDRYSALCSNTSTGLGSATEARSRSYASCTVPGQTTLSPGTCANTPSGFWLWNGPAPSPPPDGARTTIGIAMPNR